MSTKKTVDVTVLLLAVVGSLVLVNVISVYLFGRLDLTRGKEFTLSQATVDTLQRLKDPVTVTAYFTKDLPPPYSTNARYVKDLLEEYYAHSGGNLRYSFVDPTASETQEDKDKKKDVQTDIFGRAVREETSVEKDLRDVGIPPVQVRVNEADKLEVKRAYMGISIRFGDKKEAIPVVRETGGLEYDLTTMIRKVSRDKAPKIALVTGHDNPDLQKEMGSIHQLLSQLYDVVPIDLTQKAEIADDVNAILVIGPKTPFGEAEQRAIDKFVMSGRGAAFLLGPVAPDLQTLQPNPTNHGLGPLLESYGVKIEPGIVIDAECATMNVTRQQGAWRIAQPVKYPFIPLPKGLDENHPLTRGLAQVAFPFMSALTVAVPSGGPIKADVLVRSSDKSWLQSEPYNLDPSQEWKVSVLGEASSKNLAVALTGSIKSHFNKGGADQGMSVDPSVPTAAKDGRVLVVGGYLMLLDQFMSKGNETLALNLLDWLVLDEALLAVRSRGLNAAPLEEVSDAKRSTLKYFNIVGLPLAFIGFGLARWRMREGRRGRVAL